MSDPTTTVLEAARAVFRSRGYASTTVQAVAVAANVAPGVITSLYRNREALIAAALDLPLDPSAAIPRIIAPGLDGMGERLLRLALVVMDDPNVRRDGASASAGVQSAVGSTERIVALMEVLQSSIVDTVAHAMGVPDARMRAALISSTIAGLVTTRIVLRLEPLASATADEVVAVLAPTIQRYLDPTIPLGS
jgi:AcrR family transcriptional regulator